MPSHVGRAVVHACVPAGCGPSVSRGSAASDVGVDRRGGRGCSACEGVYVPEGSGESVSDSDGSCSGNEVAVCVADVVQCATPTEHCEQALCRSWRFCESSQLDDAVVRNLEEIARRPRELMAWRQGALEYWRRRAAASSGNDETGFTPPLACDNSEIACAVASGNARGSGL